MLKKIPVEDLRIGMYIVDTGLSWIDNPYLYSREGEVQNKIELTRIQREGYKEVFIDDERGGYAGAKATDMSVEERIGERLREKGPSERVRPTDLGEEMHEAKRLYKDSVKFARDFMKSASLGEQVDLDKSGAFVEDIIDSVMRNTHAMMSLSKLRSYDEYTFTHCINVAVIALAFGKFLQLPRKKLNMLGLAALFHDVGKAIIPADILNKPGRLTDSEFQLIKMHPLEGYRLLKKQKNVPPEVLKGVLEHHEKFNGKGYPKGVTGEEMHEFSRIITVADVYDALTSKRSYKKGMLPNKALSIMFGMRDEDFYPMKVERFIKCLGIYPVGSFVRVSNGEYGVVYEANSSQPLLPVVKFILSADLRPRTPEIMDLAAEGSGLKITESLDPKDFMVDVASILEGEAA